MSADRRLSVSLTNRKVVARNLHFHCALLHHPSREGSTGQKGPSTTSPNTTPVPFPPSIRRLRGTGKSTPCSATPHRLPSQPVEGS